MKLFTRYSRINVIATIFIFLVASAAFFFTLNYVLIHQIDEDLMIEEHEIGSYVQKHNRVPESMSVNDQIIDIRPAASAVRRHFTTSTLSESPDHEKEKFRQLIFGARAGGQWYQVTVSKSQEDTDALIHSILAISFVTILAMLIASFVINRLLLKRIWKPFYQSLDAVKEFKIGGDKPLQLPASSIEEFAFMNQTIERITRQAQLDYLSLKTFSENASHEIQTPIAIIRSKLDLLIQDEHLSEEQSQTLQSAYNAIQKLTKLNQSLLLLAKIENRQYEEVQQVDLKNKLEEKLTDFQELWQAQQVSVHTDLQPALVRMNAELSDILLNNLLSNATKHNFSGGSITITLGDRSLTIRNTSSQPALDTQALFQRFYKPSQSPDHNGLGLSIVKEICDASGFTVTYGFEAQQHFFSIRLG